MKISELVRQLNAIKKAFDDREILVSSDEEGNQYKRIFQVAMTEGIDADGNDAEDDTNTPVIYPIG